MFQNSKFDKTNQKIQRFDVTFSVIIYVEGTGQDTQALAVLS